ncbi:hypothetical protein NEUTE1DRAFT_100759 [Neurospora tetrasperma FGSC 2508]|uniref:Uncharacterized protein n=1 Tax=Neurospora tetrasperma (strain FGSC 2508 / ATCC MYA-4615 / P0657) TaxID=510951 RepID=F8MMJ8_NEUT8|nr:uncharacterized protein NEUTE1DRAFT_100759 [Neurospora tetrasperma FGSC 2508]EGO57872.1 hypothetical protein NEUTE1DRAFT_100759 [Neurospora tetrasperma FGSC 2508]
MAEVGVDQEVRNMARSAERVEMIVGNFIVSPKTYRSIIICAEEGTAGTCTLVDCPERDDVEVWFPIKFCRYLLFSRRSSIVFVPSQLKAPLMSQA